MVDDGLDQGSPRQNVAAALACCAGSQWPDLLAIEAAGRETVVVDALCRIVATFR